MGRVREWWQTVRIEDFRARVTTMTTPELEMLAGEISGLLVRLQTQLETGSPDAVWLASVRGALGRIAERKAFLRTQLQLRNVGTASEKQRLRARLLAEARAKVRSGDLGGAVELLLDWLEGKAPGQRD